MYLEKFIKEYQDSNPERFNADLINVKGNEDIVQLMSECCKSLEILKEIKFISCEYQSIDKVYKNNKKEDIEFNIEESKLGIINIKFEIITDEETVEVSKDLYFPELIDNKYFLINGNKFFPIFQLVDAECYRTKNSITLKTLLMPLTIRFERVTISDTSFKKSFNTKTLTLDLFRNKIPVFNYYLSKWGWEDTLKYFNVFDHIVVDNEPYEDCYTFKVNKEVVMNVEKSWLDENERQNSILVATLLSTLNGRFSLEKIYEQEYWQRKLGSYFTKNNSNHLEKGVGILSSFERILDETTKRELRIEDEHKLNSYTIVRWIVCNYEALLKQDNMDLANKRLRVYEYLMYSLVLKFSKGIYRVLNQKNVKIKSIKTIFSNIQKGFLVKSIVNNKLVRYMNNVNSIDLFANMLKVTISGPQSSSGGGVSTRMRTLHPSMIGKIDICSTSAGEPGVSLTLSPFCNLYNGLHFTEDPNINYNSDMTFDDEE